MGRSASEGPLERLTDPSNRDLPHVGRFNVAAVYATLEQAEAAAAALRDSGVPARKIVVQDRRLTDEGPAQPVVGGVLPKAPPTDEPVQTPTRRRDVEVVRTVFSRTVFWGAVAGILGAAIGFLIGLAFFDLRFGTWAALAAGAVAGSTFGAMAGGIWGGMGQAMREEGFLVELHADSQEEARRAADILSRHHPLRMDRNGVRRALRAI